MENLFSKKPPYDEKLEQIVLGSIIIEPSEFAQVMSQFRPETFYKESHKLIAKSLLKMAKANKAIDMMTVVEQLAADGVLEKVGGAFYVASLSENIGSAAHLEMHLRILIQKEIRRKIIEKASDLFNKSFDESVDLDDLLNDTSKLIDWVSKEVIKQEGETVREIQPNVIQKIEKAAQNGNGISGITSGFPSIDRITQGWQNSDMVVIAARPSMGKTAFSLSMACNIAALGIPCAFFSLEMSKEQIVQRILSMETGINSKQIRSGQLSTDEWQHLENFVTPIEGMPIVIDDQAAMKTLDFRTKAKNYVEKYGVKIIIIDYLQMMKSTEKTQNREREVAEISSTIKAVAKELNVPVIALSQLNRAVESRQGDKRPTLADLRDSGSIEQDADLVCFIHRPEKYGIEVTEDGEPTAELGQIIISKNRNGEVCDVNLHFIKEQAKFTEWQ